MPAPSTRALGIGERYRIALTHTPLRGQAGERLGRGIGASLEFQDRRPYAVGDDVRQLDWRAYARTDQLLVRQYREEVRARVELLVDASRSMAVTPAKAQLAVDLTAILAAGARAEGYEVALVALGDLPERLPLERFERDGLELSGRAPVGEGLRAAEGLLQAGSLRLCVSDFFSPHDPAALVRGLAGRAGRIGLVQVLSPEDRDPPIGAALRLVDSESEEELELVVDERARAGYLERTRRLERALARECERLGGAFVTLTADADVEDLCRGPLSDAGVLRPA